MEMFTSEEYRRIARDKLRGFWGAAVLVSFLASLLGAYGGGTGVSISGEKADFPALRDIPGEICESINGVLGAEIVTQDTALAVLAVLAAVSAVLALIGPAIRLGCNKFYIDLVLARDPGRAGTLFSRFKIFLRAFGLAFMMGLFTLLWTLLLIVPGLVAAYRYALAPYIMAEDPDVGIMEAIRRSRELMRGHKWRLFCLELSFIGWMLLSAATLFIGNLWLTPYMSAAAAAFYVDRTGRRIPLPAGAA